MIKHLVALLFATTIVAQEPIPALSVVGGAPPATPGIANPLIIQYYNNTSTDVSGATLTIRVPRATGYGPLPANCTSSGDTATCRIGLVPAKPPSGLRIPYELIVHPILPLEHDTTFTAHLTIRPDDESLYPDSTRVEITTMRTFIVTNTNDSGAGSFRAMVAAAAAICRDDMRCQIAFRIDGDEPVKTIRLQSPIPRVIATSISFDGTTQTRYGGDTNPLGPEIELNGSALSEGHGLDLQLDCTAEVRGLAINGFPGYGMVLHAFDCNRSSVGRTIHENYIGTDATGTRAVPNGRGILVDAPHRPNSQWGMTRIMNNLVSGNLRSGIWIENAMAVDIFGNTVGLNATRTAGLGNGASGIFVNTGGTGTDVFQNFIGFNAHAGVSVASGAQYVAVYANSIQANGQGGIDYGLDGPSSIGRVPTPIITEARYDAATNMTVVRGTSTARATFETSVYLHASDAPDPGGFGEGQYYLGAVRLKPGAFEARVPGDWRGKWVSGIALENIYYGWLVDGPTNGNGVRTDYQTTTSEFGNAVKVE